MKLQSATTVVERVEPTRFPPEGRFEVLFDVPDGVSYEELGGSIVTFVKFERE